MAARPEELADLLASRFARPCSSSSCVTTGRRWTAVLSRRPSARRDRRICRCRSPSRPRASPPRPGARPAAARAQALVRSQTRRCARAGTGSPASENAAPDYTIRRAGRPGRSRRRGRAAAPDVHESLGRRGHSLGAREHGRLTSLRHARSGRRSRRLLRVLDGLRRVAHQQPGRRCRSAGARVWPAGCSSTCWPKPSTPGRTAATLEVRRSNTAARALYEGLGFAVEGIRRDYYQDPREDAVILWKRHMSGQRAEGKGQREGRRRKGSREGHLFPSFSLRLFPSPLPFALCPLPCRCVTLHRLHKGGGHGRRSALT